MFTSWLLKLIDTGQGRHITELSQLRVESWMPLWLLPFLVVAIAALTFYAYSKEKSLSFARRIVLTSLRSAACVALLLVLMMPRLEIEGEGSIPGPLPLVIDGTESMTIKDENGKARIEKAKELAKELLAKNPQKKEMPIKAYFAGKEFQDYSSEGKHNTDKESSSIPQMIEQGLHKHMGEYCPGIILLSDGAHNSTELIENTAKMLKGRNIPFYPCGLGKVGAKDISVAGILGEDVIFINEKAKIYVSLNQAGYTGQKVALKLLLDDKEVYSGPHTLAAEGENSIPVEYKPTEKGVFRLKAEIEPQPGEVTKENNYYVKTVRVIDEKIRILLVFGAPSWEYRYLSGAFERDKRIEFKSYLGDVDRRRFKDKDAARTLVAELPGSAAELGKAYDVVFLSRIDAATLPKNFLEALKSFVEDQGGGLAVLADPSFIPYSLKNTPVEPLIPLSIGDGIGRSYRDEVFSPLKDGMSFELTDDGAANQLVLFSGDKEENRKIWSSLPPVYWCYDGGRVKPSTINLLVALKTKSRQSVPAIVQHSYGKGVVLFMGFDSTWRWRKEFGDRYFRDYWGKAVQFLGLPHLLNEAAQSLIFVGKENCFTGEKFSIRAKVSNPDYSPFVRDKVKMLITEDGVKKELDMQPVPGRPGIYRADYMPESEGTLALELSAKFSAKPVELRVTKARKEFQNSGMNRELLERLAKESGGQFFESSNATTMLETIWEKRPKCTINASASLWDSWLLLLLAAVLWGLEWGFRKWYCLD